MIIPKSCKFLEYIKASNHTSIGDLITFPIPRNGADFKAPGYNMYVIN